MEDYHPLKGKMFQILKPDGTLQPGEKPPLNDKETFDPLSEDGLYSIG